MWMLWYQFKTKARLKCKLPNLVKTKGCFSIWIHRLNVKFGIIPFQTIILLKLAYFFFNKTTQYQ